MNKLSAKELIALNKDSNTEFLFKKGENGEVLHPEFEKISLDKNENGFTYIVAGNLRYPIEIVEKHQNEYAILVNGVSYNFSVETPFSLQRKKMLSSKASESTIIRLKAPMPGKILEVMVKTGDSVKTGDTLLILEAMKMQNAILASRKGVIKKIHVKENDACSKSDLLIELEKEN